MSEPECPDQKIADHLQLMAAAEEIEELLRQFARQHQTSFAQEDRFGVTVVSAMLKSRSG